MFNPSRAEVRLFFMDAWRRHQDHAVLSPLEAVAVDWIVQHPEYRATLESGEDALEADYPPEAGLSNPFLHLSMHLSIAEQVSIDQPAGIRAATAALTRRLGSLHEAHHGVMECLAEMLWTAQRDGTAPDGAAYVECVARRARRDTP